MSTWQGKRNGVKGTYLDSPFAPRFFPDTPEGKDRLARQIGAEIKMAFVLIGLMAIGYPAAFFGAMYLAGQ